MVPYGTAKNVVTVGAVNFEDNLTTFSSCGPTRDGRLKPDMFANVEIVTDFHGTAISIPLSAVLDDGGKSVVFVFDGNDYKKTAVTLGLKSNDRVEIIDGLKEGDKVVVKGNYLLLEQSKTVQ